MDLESTLIILKPDVIQRGLIGEIVRRIERKGLRIAGMKMMKISRKLAAQHYEEHQGKSFYISLLDFITRGPVVAMVVSGPRAVTVMRMMMGKTNAKEAMPGTIRGDWGLSNRFNLIHGSDSPTSAEREISLFFTPDEIFEYHRAAEPWIDPDASW